MYKRQTWDPATTKVLGQKIEEMKNFYNDSINGGALTDARLGWYDKQFGGHVRDPIGQFVGNVDKLKEMVQSNRTRRDIELKSLGVSPPGQQSNTPQQNPKEVVKYTPNGRAVVVDASTGKTLRWK